MIYFFLLSGLFLGWSFGANDTANIFGTAVETKMISFKQAALIAAIFVTLGAVLEGAGPSQTLSKLGTVNAIGGAFTVALAAAATITLMVKVGIPVSTTQTLAGAIIGWNYFAGRLTDFNSLATIASSWLLAPLLGAIFAFCLFFIFQVYLNKTKIHLLELDWWTRIWLLVVGAFGAYSLGANNIANIVGVFVPVNPFQDIPIRYLGTLSGGTQLFLLGSLSIVVGIYTYSQRTIKTVGKDLFSLSPLTGLIAVLSESLVLFLFSSKWLFNTLLSLGIHPLPLVPVSASQIIIGSVLGIGLAKGGKNIRYGVLGRISIGWVTAPVIAFLFSFVALFIFQNVFEQTVQQNTRYVFDRQTITKIGQQGFDTKPLSTVNGRSFTNELELYGELKAQNSFDRASMLQIIRLTEVHPIAVNVSVLESKGLKQEFSPEQWASLLKLDQQSYRHTWQLADALGQSPGWMRFSKPANAREKDANRRIDSHLDLLYRTFTPPVVKK